MTTWITQGVRTYQYVHTKQPDLVMMHQLETDARIRTNVGQYCNCMWQHRLVGNAAIFLQNNWDIFSIITTTKQHHHTQSLSHPGGLLAPLIYGYPSIVHKVYKYALLRDFIPWNCAPFRDIIYPELLHYYIPWVHMQYK